MKIIKCFALLFLQLCVAESSFDCTTLFADVNGVSDSASTLGCLGPLLERNDFIKAANAVEAVKSEDVEQAIEAVRSANERV